jgi:CDP-diacylglycerol--glycerol-3-phosphate 3-phosphatidyltransferase
MDKERRILNFSKDIDHADMMEVLEIFSERYEEMAVTSLRLVVSKSSGVVVAAAWAGKLKTVSQMACVAVVLLEPAICAWIGWRMRYVGSYTLLAVATVLTVYSGYGYFKSYWSVLRESQ